MSKSKYHALQHIFLIAMPRLADPLFCHSVVYLWEYNEKGASGIIINKPLDFTLGEVLQQLEITPEDPRANDYLVLQGGPVAREQGFIVRRRHHPPDESGKSTIDITVSSSKQDLINFANEELGDRENGELGDCLIALGCAGWDAGQLDRELKNNDWLIAPFNETTLFDVLSTNNNGASASTLVKWYNAAARVGVDLSRLSSEVGHA